MRPLHALPLALALVSGCADQPAPVAPPAPTPTPPTPGGTVERPRPDTVTPGGATPVDPGTTPGTTARPTLPLSDPAMSDGHVGRAPRRLSVRQLRASLETAVGVTWRQRATILSAEYSAGSYVDENADMLSLLSVTLGQPDYNNFTSEVLDPGAVFSKLVGDAARKACRDGLLADAARPRERRLLLRYAETNETAASSEANVRRNIAYLVQRFWARTVAPTDATVTPLLDIFRAGSTAPAEPEASLPAGTPVDGWRAVCVALVTDSQFLTY